MTYQITTQAELRAAFWNDNGILSRKRERNGDYCTDTRVEWVDFIDMLCRDGIISEELAQRATL